MDRQRASEGVVETHDVYVVWDDVRSADLNICR